MQEGIKLEIGFVQVKSNNAFVREVLIKENYEKFKYRQSGCKAVFANF